MTLLCICKALSECLGNGILPQKWRVSEKLFCTQFDGIELLPGRLKFLLSCWSSYWYVENLLHFQSKFRERPSRWSCPGLERQHSGREQVPLLRGPTFGFHTTACNPMWFLVSLAWLETYIYVYTHIGMRTQLQISSKVSSAWCGGTHL